jgi:hypothetical protein
MAYLKRFQQKCGILKWKQLAITEMLVIHIKNPIFANLQQFYKRSAFPKL